VDHVGLSELLKLCLIDGVFHQDKKLKTEFLLKILMIVVDSHAVWDVTEDIQVQPGHISNLKVYQPEMFMEILNGAKLIHYHHVTITSQENTDHAQLLDQPLHVNKNVTTISVILQTKMPIKDLQYMESPQKSQLSKQN